MGSWPDPLKPTKTVKERREGCKDEVELSLPTIPYGDPGAERQTQHEGQLQEKNEMHQSPSASPRFRQGPKCGGYERKEYNGHAHHNPIQNGQVLGKDEVKQSYEHPIEYGTSDEGDQENYDIQDTAT